VRKTKEDQGGGREKGVGERKRKKESKKARKAIPQL
jgi:hypothetical protein